MVSSSMLSPPANWEKKREKKEKSCCGNVNSRYMYLCVLYELIIHFRFEVFIYLMVVPCNDICFIGFELLFNQPASQNTEDDDDDEER